MKTKQNPWKIFLIFLFLLGITLLLLEIPKQYYKIFDQNLFEEHGVSKYETKVTKTMDDFSSKLDSFLSYEPASSTNGIGYTRELTSQETDEVFPKLIQEFETMTNGTPEDLIEAMKDSSARTQCFTAQVFQLIKSEQFIWEVGYLEFYLPKLDVNGKIIYDTDSYKIIFIFWYSDLSQTENSSHIVKGLDDTAIYDYYAGISEDICILYYPDYSIIYPFSVAEYYLEANSLLQELNELGNYFWNGGFSGVISNSSDYEMQK